MKKFLGSLFILCWTLSLANSAFSESQALLFGTVRVPVLTFKVLLVVTAALSAFLYRKWILGKRSLAAWWAIFVLCIFTSASVVAMRGTISLRDQTVGFLTIYLYMIAVPLCTLSKPLIKLSHISMIICVIFVPLALLGIAQYVFNDPIVATSTPDESLQITSWMFHDQVRAFSLFASSLDFSYFLALVCGLFTAFIFEANSSLRKKLFAGFGLVLVAFATYTTITRIAYLFVPLTSAFSALLSRRKTLSKIPWALIPIGGFILGVFFVVALPLYLQQSGLTILSDESLIERLFYWGSALSTWLNAGTATFLFGTGVAPGVNNPGYIVDNTFLNFAVQSGVFGLAAATVFMLAIWMALRSLVHSNAKPEVIAIVAFWATFLLAGTFNVVNATYFLALLPLLISDTWALKEIPATGQTMGTLIVRPL